MKQNKFLPTREIAKAIGLSERNVRKNLSTMVKQKVVVYKTLKVPMQKYIRFYNVRKGL